MKAPSLTIAQLCERWPVSRRHIHRLITCGDLVAINLSTSGTKKTAKYIFELAEIERFEASRKTRVEEPKKRLGRRAAKQGAIERFF